MLLKCVFPPIYSKHLPAESKFQQKLAEMSKFSLSYFANREDAVDLTEESLFTLRESTYYSFKWQLFMHLKSSSPRSIQFTSHIGRLRVFYKVQVSTL